MALTFHRTLQPLSWLRHKVSAAFLLQADACAVVTWSLLHGGITLAPDAPAVAANASAGSTAIAASGPAAPGTPRPSSSMRLAAAPGLAEAQLALSTIDVIVTRHDTLDRI